MRRWVLVVLVSEAGCDDLAVGPRRDGCPTPFRASPEGGCSFDEHAVIGIARTFRRGGLEKINAEPFEQVFAAGPLIQRNVWVSPLDVAKGGTAADLYAEIDPFAETELDDAFPVGTVIVHEAVNGEEGNAIQIKREDTWDDGQGRRWWFTKIYEDGTADDNPCTPCVSCHNLGLRPGSDGLWGVPREAL